MSNPTDISNTSVQAVTPGPTTRRTERNLTVQTPVSLYTSDTSTALNTPGSPSTDWTDSDAMDFIIQEMAEFRRIDDQNLNPTQQALYDNGITTIFDFIILEDTEIRNLRKTEQGHKIPILRETANRLIQ